MEIEPGWKVLLVYTFPAIVGIIVSCREWYLKHKEK